MPTRDTAPIGAPCWVDLSTSDTERSRAFYCRLFGWTAEGPAEEFGGYVNFTKDGVRVAGCMASQPGSGVPDVWSVYLAADDASKTVDAANAGQVHVHAMDVGDLGTMALISDPGGAGIGIWQPGLHQGFGVLSEPGAPSWFELHTRDYQATVGFYRTVFGWNTHVVRRLDPDGCPGHAIRPPRDSRRPHRCPVQARRSPRGDAGEHLVELRRSPHCGELQA